MCKKQLEVCALWLLQLVCLWEGGVAGSGRESGACDWLAWGSQQNPPRWLVRHLHPHERLVLLSQGFRMLSLAIFFHQVPQLWALISPSERSNIVMPTLSQEFNEFQRVTQNWQLWGLSRFYRWGLICGLISKRVSFLSQWQLFSMTNIWLAMLLGQV